MQRTEGEIDFVASPNLTARPYDEWTLLGRTVKVETAAEIVAKKLWHRGDRATARDLFDLSLVIEQEPEALATAVPYLVRHRDASWRRFSNGARCWVRSLRRLMHSAIGRRTTKR